MPRLRLSAATVQLATRTRIGRAARDNSKYRQMHDDESANEPARLSEDEPVEAEISTNDKPSPDKHEDKAAAFKRSISAKRFWSVDSYQ